MRMLGTLVTMLDDERRFVSELAALGRRHVGYGASAADYDAVGAALLIALERGLGERFTPATREAWAEAYRLMAAIMRRAAVRLAD